MMNDRIKKLWVKALRSGEYEQAEEVLRNYTNDGYCCLGVLTDLYVKETGDEGAWDGTDNFNLLSNSVVEWASLNDVDPRVVRNPDHVYRSTRTLSQLNDTENMNFEEIADTIEREL